MVDGDPEALIMIRLLPLIGLLAMATALAACGDDTLSSTTCTVGTTNPCPCPDGSQGTQTCDNTGGFGLCSCASPGGACGVINQVNACTCSDGTAGTMSCGSTLTWGLCSCAGGTGSTGGACTPGAKQTCITSCGSSIGSQTCPNTGVWGTCVPPAEECNGVDDDCDGKADENLHRACQTACGVGTESCLNGSWQGCTAQEPGEEVCDGKDNDCDGKVDLAANGTPLEQDCFSDCGQGSQTCINATWGACSAAPTKEICDGLDNNCDGFVDNADGGCNCAQGQTQPCGTTAGTCKQGEQTCLSGGVWSECGGANYQGPVDEACDGLDNDCDGQTDEGNPGGGMVCGTANNSQGGAFSTTLPCTLGLLSCVQGQIQCVGGVDPLPEVCDEIDNDCDGQVDEDPTGDQYEPNDTCPVPEDLGYVLENQGWSAFQGNIFPSGDEDWFRITAKELGDTCVNGSEGSYTLEAQLSSPGVDYDICISSSCSGTEDCSFQGVGQIDTASSESWQGTCGVNDDKIFYVQVKGYTADDLDACKPYTLELRMVSQGGSDSSGIPDFEEF